MTFCTVEKCVPFWTFLSLKKENKSLPLSLSSPFSVTPFQHNELRVNQTYPPLTNELCLTKFKIGGSSMVERVVKAFHTTRQWVLMGCNKS